MTTIASTNNEHSMIYDFYGFHEKLYAIKYRVKGSVEIAARIQKLLKAQHIETQLDTKRDLDHRIWDLPYSVFKETLSG